MKKTNETEESKREQVKLFEKEPPPKLSKSPLKIDKSILDEVKKEKKQTKDFTKEEEDNDNNNQNKGEQIYNPQAIGDITLRCWNCQNINLVKSNWKVIQCPVCNKMNRIPKQRNQIEEILTYLKANTVVSYADSFHTVPLTNYFVMCPYCKTDNKIRETANHCICYACRNSWSLKKPNDNLKEEESTLDSNPLIKSNDSQYYKYDKTGVVYPPERALRFSDLFFPDPMFYPGYYPINSLSPLYPEYYTPYDDKVYALKKEKIMNYNKEFLKYKLGPFNDTTPTKYSMMNKLKEIDRKTDQLLANKIIPYSTHNVNNSMKNDDKIKAYENTFFIKK